MTDEHGLVIWREPNKTVYPAFLQSKWANSRFGPFFEMLAKGDYSAMDSGFDSSVITNDRPFPSVALTSVPEVRHLLTTTAAMCIALAGLIVLTALSGESNKMQMASLLAYNVAIGFAYFLVEIMLIQAYHGVFLSPSASLILVLAVLLIGSGFGGLLAGRLPLLLATGVLTPLLLVGVRLPDWMIMSGWSPSLVAVATAATVFAVGFLMGVFFPHGLRLAAGWQMRSKIPHLFAVNSIAGAMATVVSLYLGIRVGYSWTLILAVILYVLATLIVGRRTDAVPDQQREPATTKECAANGPPMQPHEVAVS
jgi:hypothetical protein